MGTEYERYLGSLPYIRRKILPVTSLYTRTRVCEGKGCLPANSISVEKGVIFSLLKDNKLVNNNFVPLEDETQNFPRNIISQLRDLHHSDNAYGGINVRVRKRRGVKYSSTNTTVTALHQQLFL